MCVDSFVRLIFTVLLCRLFDGFGHSEPKIDVLSACYISTVDGKAVLSGFDHGNGFWSEFD